MAIEWDAQRCDGRDDRAATCAYADEPSIKIGIVQAQTDALADSFGIPSAKGAVLGSRSTPGAAWAAVSSKP